MKNVNRIACNTLIMFYIYINHFFYYCYKSYELVCSMQVQQLRLPNLIT